MSSVASLKLAPKVPVLADSFGDNRVRSAVLVVAGALLTALCAQIVIPMTPVPMTGQTFAVIVVGASLGCRRSVESMLLYVAMGFFLPVYAEGGSGIETLWGASGGYLLGFVLAAGVVGWLAERGTDRKVLTAFLSFVVGQLIIFVPGLIVLHLSTGLGWSETIHSGFTVFILGGLVKAAAAGAIMPAAWKFREWEADRS